MILQCFLLPGLKALYHLNLPILDLQDRDWLAGIVFMVKTDCSGHPVKSTLFQSCGDDRGTQGTGLLDGG